MPARHRRTARSKLSVRPAGVRDLDALVLQRRAMWKALGVRNNELHEKGDRVYRRWARARLRNHQLMAWVVKSDDGRMAGGGCVWLQPVQPRPHRASMVQPYLLSMYTAPDFRRRGVASMVVKEAIKWCRKQGYERLMLHASEMGRRVYSQLGFKRTWEMRLDLAHK
ncbi:GNAT family N-acetyltransferase [Candidatus Bathyarchaeota archaeon]|nr:MAG: GNAT family N-acetyltransferase [Candidatus Bathyarchaeota archaeon]